jgi:DNA topoisomerase-1
MVLKWGRFGKYFKCLNCGASRDAEPKAGSNGGANGTESAANGEEVAEPEACELCGKQMQLKRGRFGPFLGCTGYPECRNIRKIAKSGVAAPAPVPLDEKCPVDDAQLVRRFGRYGEFISCSNYPKCKYIKQESTGVKCPRPGCEGELVVKKSKRGKLFYGCGTYPDCDRVYWDKPVVETCPNCNAPFLLEKTTKKQGTFRHCANEECGYSSNQGASEPTPAKRPTAAKRKAKVDSAS